MTKKQSTCVPMAGVFPPEPACKQAELPVAWVTPPATLLHRPAEWRGHVWRKHTQTFTRWFPQWLLSYLKEAAFRAVTFICTLADISFQAMQDYLLCFIGPFYWVLMSKWSCICGWVIIKLQRHLLTVSVSFLFKCVTVYMHITLDPFIIKIYYEFHA